MNNSQKKFTVTVAISAFNEEKSILLFLNSVLKQEQKSFILKKILIISDGSTDKTVSKVKNLKSPLIKLKIYDHRLGKSARLNQIYKNLDTDFLIQSDADVVFAHKNVIEQMINPMILDERVGMCGANTQPLPGITFTEKAVNVTHPIYSKFRETVRGGNNWFSASGKCLAIRKQLVNKIKVPDDIIGNDRFAYLSCLVLDYKYKYVKKAIVNYRSSQTLKDHISQNSRFLAIPIRMKRYFDPKLVKKETKIPRILLLRGLAIQFLKHPLLSAYIFVVNRYCQFRALKTEEKMKAKWPIALSTKSLHKSII